MKFGGVKALLLALGLLPVVCTQGQQVIYNNTSQPLLGTDGNPIKASIATEYGEEIILGGTARQVQAFAFEYFAQTATQGDEFARVKFYREDAGGWIQPNGQPSTDYLLPGSVIWDSGLFPVQEGYNTRAFTAEFANKTVVVPNVFIWSIQFYGISQTAGDKAGLLYYYFPTVGLSFNDIWEKRANGWVPTANDNLAKNNFNAYLVAVPEPSTLALGTLAIVVAGGALIRRRSAKVVQATE